MKNDKIYILGFGNSRHSKVFESNARIWTLNDWFNFPQERNFKRFHVTPERIYQIHENFDGKHPVDETRFKEWRKKYEQSGALIVVRTDFSFNKQRIYNMREKVEKYGTAFFSSTMSYMIADAIDEGVKIIEFVGVDLQEKSEYEYQMPGLLYSCRVAEEHGLKVIIPHKRHWIERAERLKINWASLPEVRIMYGDDPLREVAINAS